MMDIRKKLKEYGNATMWRSDPYWSFMRKEHEHLKTVEAEIIAEFDRLQAIEQPRNEPKSNEIER